MIVENSLRRLYIKMKENKIKNIKYLGWVNNYAACVEVEYADEKTIKHSILSKEFWKLNDEDFKNVSAEIELITKEVFLRAKSAKVI